VNTILLTFLLSAFTCAPAVAEPPSPVGAPDSATQTTTLDVQVNRSTILDLAAGFKRISVTNGDIAEAVAITSTELLVNGKAPGETSLFLWDPKGVRHLYTVRVLADEGLLELIHTQLVQEVGPNVTLTLDGPSIFLKGTVQTVNAAARAFAIASAYPGVKVVNLLRVTVPSAEPQILLKVRFADVDRSLSAQYGINLFGLNPKGIATSTTGQFGTPPTISSLGSGATGTLTNLLNIMYYRPDINLGAVLQDLEAKNIIQILAEPNLLTLSGHQASFLAGGEFPFPTIQGGASGVGQITIQFKEFGIRLNFLPTITPRGTIHLVVMPEVSSLDYSNGLTVGGFTVPGLATKRVTTEIELASGQSFAIAGLLDNQITENLDRMGGLASIPVLGALFKSRSVTKNHSELLVVVTPELVTPILATEKPPTVPMQKPFIPGQIPDRLGNPTDQLGLQQDNVLPVEELTANDEATTAPAAMNTSGVTPPPTPIPQLPAATASPKKSE
jgi:pilus assembly protein CpaC